jgi:hypothetical protein
LQDRLQIAANAQGFLDLLAGDSRVIRIQDDVLDRVGGNAVCPFLRCQRNGASSEQDTIPALGSVETVMEASVCPMCTRALKISMIEPHPTRD